MGVKTKKKEISKKKKELQRTGLTAGIAVLLPFMAAAVLFSGCGGKKEEHKPEKHYTIGVVTKSRNSEYWMSVCSGMEKAAAQLGAEVFFLYPDSEADLQVQKRMLHDLIKKEVDAIAVSPIDSWDNEEEVNTALAKNMKVYAYDTRIMDADVPYIGIDNIKTGYELAETMDELLGGSGRVGIVTGLLSQTPHAERLEGFQNFIQEKPGLDLVFVESGYANLQMSEQEIARVKREYPDLDGIMATSAVTALGISEGIMDDDIIVVSVDAQADALRAVQDGRIAALAAQSGYEIGFSTIEYIVNDLNGVIQEQEWILPAEIITSKNNTTS